VVHQLLETRMTHSVALEAIPQSADMKVIVQGLLEFNRVQSGGSTPEYLVVTLRDEQGKVAGGLVGATYLGWLQVNMFWLPDDLRGRGYGTELLALAEKEALHRGCTRAFLETLSFQALPFYEKRGYTIHSRLEGFPVGGARYALTKDLSAA
jgi:GNAT superfamily N-acetyltransferase